MTDTFDRETRSWIMRQVLSKGTRPELAVCDALQPCQRNRADPQAPLSVAAGLIITKW
jgi:G:T-mismatch repair DNA endonuclease (very short patch repair protein)